MKKLNDANMGILDLSISLACALISMPTMTTTNLPKDYVRLRTFEVKQVECESETIRDVR